MRTLFALALASTLGLVACAGDVGDDSNTDPTTAEPVPTVQLGAADGPGAAQTDALNTYLSEYVGQKTGTVSGGTSTTTTTTTTDKK